MYGEKTNLENTISIGRQEGLDSKLKNILESGKSRANIIAELINFSYDTSAKKHELHNDLVEKANLTPEELQVVEYNSLQKMNQLETAEKLNIGVEEVQNKSSQALTKLIEYAKKLVEEKTQ